MRLIVNLSMLGDNPTGLGVYADKCVGYLSHRYRLEYVGNPKLKYQGVLAVPSPKAVEIGGGLRAAIRRYKWASGLKFADDVLVYSPTHHGFPNSKRQILTIHDLVCIRHPIQHPPQHAYFRYILPRQLRKCEAVFAVSETTKRDVADFFGYPADRIFVVPNSVNVEDFQAVPDDEADNGPPYLLMVGAHYPHKNVEEVFARFEMWVSKYRLVIASCGGPHKTRLLRLAQYYGIADCVDFRGYLSRAELVRLYRHAKALIYPSKWEGFGIPPMEGLASGCRVILSDIPVHREIYGGACHFVALGAEDSWGDAFAALERPRPADMQRGAERILARYTAGNTGKALVEALRTVDPRLVPIGDE